MKKCLVLSVTAGQGHHSCGKAVCDYFNAHGVETVMIDTLRYINPLISHAVANGYLVATEYSPPLYGSMYRLAEKRRPRERGDALAKLASMILKGNLLKYINEYDPQVIVCTHVFSAYLLTTLGLSHIIKVGIVTDFTIHPFWETTHMDYYVTASELLNLQLIKKGISPDKALPIGIPIRDRFNQRMSRAEACAQLGIENKETLLMMSGSMGYGNMVRSVEKIDALSHDFQILAVCGNNADAQRRIESIPRRHDIYAYGYVDTIDVMMDAADILITKPGGLSTSEAMAKGVPIVLTTPIPGQENRNVEFLLNNGLAMMSSPTTPIDECVYQLFSEPGRLTRMREALEHYGKRNANQALFEKVILQGSLS